MFFYNDEVGMRRDNMGISRPVGSGRGWWPSHNDVSLCKDEGNNGPETSLLCVVRITNIDDVVAVRVGITEDSWSIKWIDFLWQLIQLPAMD